MQLFYAEDINNNSKEYIFDKVESRHIVKVLRKTEGDILSITDGKGNLYTVKIIHANDKKCIVSIIDKLTKKKTWNYYLHLAIAPTKNNDRLEWFLEKATEIGIDEISLLKCDHSERKIVKHDRLEKVVVSAMKQSLKYNLPKLNELVSFKDFILNSQSEFKFIAHCEDNEKKLLKQELEEIASKNNSPNITILIGPEGDFSVNEIEVALQQNFSPISLGESRLRTETAGIVATQTTAIILD